MTEKNDAMEEHFAECDKNIFVVKLWEWSKWKFYTFIVRWKLFQYWGTFELSIATPVDTFTHMEWP